MRLDWGCYMLSDGQELPMGLPALPQRFVGDSPGMSEIKRLAAGVSSRRSTVMILGETGSGKEMLARFIHQQSDRREKPFIPVDCSTLSEHLFESELFGHV